MALSWHRHVLKTNKYINLQKVLNMKLNRNTYEEDFDQYGNSTLGNASLRREEEHGKKLRMNFGTTEIDGEAWLTKNLHKSEER
jgi:hypothetical protein